MVISLFFERSRFMKYSGIGGQAVIEGIMMKNKDDYAVAVRKPDGQIEVKTDRYVSMAEKVKFFSLPFIRGVFSFADSMILGMRALTFSTSFFEDDEDSSPSRFELWLDKVFGSWYLYDPSAGIKQSFKTVDHVRYADGIFRRCSSSGDFHFIHQTGF